MPRLKQGLTKKQERFIERYLVHFNSTRAAKEAGYSERSAKYIGYENLRKPAVQEALAKRQKELLKETGELTPEELHRRHSETVRLDPGICIF